MYLPAFRRPLTALIAATALTTAVAACSSASSFLAIRNVVFACL